MRGVSRLVAGFSGVVAAIGLATSPVRATEGPSEARESAFCGELFVDPETNNERNASYSAGRHARENPGVVGISIFVGVDLPQDRVDDLARALEVSFENRGVPARCFVDRTLVEGGTGIRFHVRGLAYPSSGPSYIIDDFYAPDNNGSDIIDGIAAEARTGNMLLAERGDDYTNRP